MRHRMAVVVGLGLALVGPVAADEHGSPIEGSRVRFKTTVPVVNVEGITVGSPGSWLAGRLVGLEAEALTVAPDGAATHVRVAPSSLSRLQVSRGRSRGKGALIGAGMAAGLGLGWAIVEEKRCEAQGQWFCELAYGLPVLTTPVGAVVGAVVGAERWRDAEPAKAGLTVTPTRGGVRVSASIAF